MKRPGDPQVTRKGQVRNQPLQGAVAVGPRNSTVNILAAPDTFD